jgi:hypothetical protein
VSERVETLAGFGLCFGYDFAALAVDNDAADPATLVGVEVEGAFAATPP